MVVVTGDRGLCGGYNSAVLKKAEQRIKELGNQSVEVELIILGNKGRTYFGKRALPIMYEAETGNNPSAEQASTISEKILTSFNAGEIDRIELIYTKFVSLITTRPTIRTLIPLLPTGMEMLGDELHQLTGTIAGHAKHMHHELRKETVFEQEPTQLVNALLPLYLNGQILRSVQESLASELSARMQAMSAATDNANELQQTLETKMNRARQAAITQELAEICAGAAAAQ
jgi:F-type H+-transporting ATPase subunit gamma